MIGAILCVITGGAAAADDAPAPPLFKVAPTDKQIDAWIDQHLDLSSWVVIGMSDSDVLTLTDRPGDKSAYPLVKDWIKWERFRDRPGTPPRSAIWRVTVNCRDQTSKLVSVTSYSGNNARGTVTDSWTAPSYEAFKEHAPGTLGEAYVEAICRSAENSDGG